MFNDVKVLKRITQNLYRNMLIWYLFLQSKILRLIWMKGKQLMNYLSSWWRRQMKTFSALLTICAGKSSVTGEFPAQRPVTRSFDVFFDLRLNERLSKQSWGWLFQTPSRPLKRHSIACCRVLSPGKWSWKSPRNLLYADTLTFILLTESYILRGTPSCLVTNMAQPSTDK